MEAHGSTTTQPANAGKGAADKGGKAVSADLLSRSNFGIHITGRVDAVGDVRHREGKAKSGNDFSFYQQSIAVSVGGEMFEVTFRADNAPVPAGSALCLYELDEVVRIKVTNPRLYNGKISFDAAEK